MYRVNPPNAAQNLATSQPRIDRLAFQRQYGEHALVHAPQRFPLQANRRRWAELAAWTALSLKHRRHPGDWQSFAILARELLETRPLEEIGLMTAIAGTTLAVMDVKGLPGTRHAA